MIKWVVIDGVPPEFGIEDKKSSFACPVKIKEPSCP